MRDSARLIRRVRGDARQESAASRPGCGSSAHPPVWIERVWNAATGSSGQYELWTIDLSAYAGSDVEISLTYASDRLIQTNGVLIDDIDAPGLAGDTSFEDDGDALDGWTVSGAPEDSIGNENDWIVGREADGPPPVEVVVDNSFARQPEIISFLSGYVAA